MKKLALILLLFCCLSLTGCSRDTQANAFMKEYASVTSQVAEKLNEGNPDEARKIFESKKDSLNAKWDAVKGSMSFQLNAETKKRMNTEPLENMKDLTEVANKAVEKNPSSQKKVEALVLDIANVVRR